MLLKEMFDQDLPETFRSGDDFYKFVMWRFPHPDTHVEHQGGGAWLAEIHGDPTYEQAVYDETNGYVDWIPRTQ